MHNLVFRCLPPESASNRIDPDETKSLDCRSYLRLPRTRIDLKRLNDRMVPFASPRNLHWQTVGSAPCFAPAGLGVQHAGGHRHDSS